VDAAYGTGLSRPYAPPDPGTAPVLAVDIPSGLSGLTGRPVVDPATGAGGAVRAARTVTFAAYKPGLLLGDGPDHTGRSRWPTSASVRSSKRLRPPGWSPTPTWPGCGRPRRRGAHKWQSAVQVVAGSPGMYGAPMLVSRGALRAGAGYVMVGVPGAPPGGGLPPGEYVAHQLPADEWVDEVAAHLRRVQALVIGPGLGDPDGIGPHGTGTDSSVAKLLAGASVPTVVDADGLRALGDLDTQPR
jgi:hypothetical protein